MKTLLVVAALTTGLCIAALYQPLAPPHTETVKEVNRFHLVSGQIAIYSERPPRVEPAILKIDTATGQVWKLITMELPPKPPKALAMTVAGFLRIADDLDAVLKSAQQAQESMNQISLPSTLDDFLKPKP
jgi:hypothetical protein